MILHIARIIILLLLLFFIILMAKNVLVTVTVLHRCCWGHFAQLCMSCNHNHITVSQIMDIFLDFVSCLSFFLPSF